MRRFVIKLGPFTNRHLFGGTPWHTVKSDRSSRFLFGREASPGQWS